LPGINRILQKVSLPVFVSFFLFCAGGPTQPQFPDPLEFESVWQFLKVYSIHQQRVPQNAFVYDSPEEMMESIKDTLRDGNYTRYGLLNHSLSKSRFSGTASGDDVTFYNVNSFTAMITISEFNTGTTYNEFLSVVPLAASYSDLILDLRDNLGGDLKEMGSIIECFLPAGKEYILARERKYDSKTGKAETLEWHPWVTKRDSKPELSNKKLTVLVNGRTASAAEILAAALKDCYPAKLVGQQTYGKAIGQIILLRRGRPDLHITYLQLRGISFGDYQGIGIKPDSIAFHKTLPASPENFFASGYRLVREEEILSP